MERVEAEVLGREAAALSLVEVGLGSVLHGFRVPFTGYLLSLNQGFFLSRAVSQSRGMAGARALPLEIGAVAACLKSLSPAGKKLTPMLAISMQGVFFSAGTFALGVNLPGAIIGSILCSLWAFLQPLILYTLLYGRTLAEVGTYYLDKFGLWSWVASLVIFKCALAAVLAVAGFRMSQARFERYQALLRDAGRRSGAASPVPAPSDWSVRAATLGALRDLTRPLFLASLVLTALFFVMQDRPASETVWKLLRPIALGFCLFFALRTPLLLEVAGGLRRLGMRRLGAGFEAALTRVVKHD